MSRPLRLGGRSALADGVEVVWSLAEGSGGRRWRESVRRDGALVRSLLLEVDRAGRPSRLELTTTTGLLTLHPSADEGELHGNIVSATGVRHLRFDWSGEHELLVLGSPAGATVSLQRLAEVVPAGEQRLVPMLRIDDGLEPRPVAWHVERTGPRSWRLVSAAGDEERTLSLDSDGLVVLDGAEVWPLELD